MITVEEATRIIMENSPAYSHETVPLRDALDRVLAVDILADRDFPPFDRVTMDGIAIAFSEIDMSSENTFVIQDMQAAGDKRKTLLPGKNCIEVMTGSVLPEDADTVIPYEHLTLKGNNVITKDPGLITKGQNIHWQGADARADDIILKSRLLCSPAEIALLATVGLSTVTVLSRPDVAVVGTGNELVEIAEKPEPHQIRRSNVYALDAALHSMKCRSTIYHIPDRKDVLLSSLQSILANHEIVIVSGGVSKGKFDLLPEALQDLGVKKLFHQVSQRPGKPMWFGSYGGGKLVFALPGNPVSTFMCFCRYVRPLLLQTTTRTVKPFSAVLTDDISFPHDLTYFLQVKIVIEKGMISAHPAPGGGSGDFVNLKDADGFLELPRGKRHFKAGEVYDLIPFR